MHVQTQHTQSNLAAISQNMMMHMYMHIYLCIWIIHIYVRTYCTISNIRLIIYVFYVPFVVCHHHSFSSYFLYPLLHMVLFVDLQCLQFPENKFELLYSYVTRFAKRGLIHAQFQETLFITNQ